MTNYVPTEWTNEVPSTTPLKYQIIDDTTGEIAASATIELITPVTAGTPVNAANLNHIEQGLVDLEARLDASGWIAGRYVSSNPWNGDTITLTPNTEYVLNLHSVFGVPVEAKAVAVWLAAARGYTGGTSFYSWLRMGTPGLNNTSLAVRFYIVNYWYDSTGIIIPNASGNIALRTSAYTPNNVVIEISAYLV